MIIGIGIDISCSDRFRLFSSKKKDFLLKVFTKKELDDCSVKNEQNQYIDEKLASRFAAKEAFYKAFSQALIFWKYTDTTISFLSVAKYVETSKSDWGVPYLSIDWNMILRNNKFVGKDSIRIHLSLSHEKLYAVAIVVIECVERC
jgi:holo-[acyl-carrier protein] synthase